MSARKIISCLTVLCFLFSSVFSEALYAVVETARSSGELRDTVAGGLIPVAAGRITGGGYSGSGTVVINIQDLHCHPEVQRNIAQILSLLDAKYTLRKVYVEGAAGEVDTGWLSGLPDAGFRKDLAETLVDQGKLTGAEYYAFLSGRAGILSGLEDDTLYRENFDRLSRIIGNTGKYGQLIEELRGDLAAMKETHFNGPNRRFENIVERYRRGDLAADAYYRLLWKYADKLNTGSYGYGNIAHFDRARYRNVNLYLRMNDARKHLNTAGVRRELAGFVALLKNRLPYSAYGPLAEQTDNFRNIDELARRLPALSREYRLGTDAAFPNLQHFFAYLEMNRDMNPLLLAGEERRLVQGIRAGLSEDVAEYEVSFLADFLGYFEDYLGNRISADDYSYFRERSGDFHRLWAKYASADRFAGREEELRLLDDFNRVNLERNQAFLRNILAGRDVPPAVQAGAPETIDPIGETVRSLARARDVVVVVAGGFHTGGIERLLAERGISYLSITPHVTQETAVSDRVYRELAEEQSRILSQSFALYLLAKYAPSDRVVAVLESELAGKLSGINGATTVRGFARRSLGAVLGKGADRDAVNGVCRDICETFNRNFPGSTIEYRAARSDNDGSIRITFSVTPDKGNVRLLAFRYIPRKGTVSLIPAADASAVPEDGVFAGRGRGEKNARRLITGTRIRKEELAGDQTRLEAIESARASLDETSALMLPDNRAKAEALKAKLAGKIGNRFIVDLIAGLYIGVIELPRTLAPFSFYEDHYRGVAEQERQYTTERKAGIALIWAAMIGTMMAMSALDVHGIVGIAAIIAVAASNVVTHGLWDAVVRKAPLALGENNEGLGEYCAHDRPDLAGLLGEKLQYLGKAEIGGEKDKEFWLDGKGRLWIFKINRYADQSYRPLGTEMYYSFVRKYFGHYGQAYAMTLRGREGTLEKALLTGDENGIDWTANDMPVIERFNRHAMRNVEDAENRGHFDRLKMTDRQLKQLLQEMVIDWLFSNHDAHAANYLLSPDGTLIGIDKEQLYKYFPNDRLNLNYTPNGLYFTPLHYAVLKNLAAQGKLSLNLIDATLAKLEGIPEAEFVEIFRPFAAAYAAAHKRLYPSEDVFIDDVLERKVNLRKEFSRLFAGLQRSPGSRFNRQVEENRALAGKYGVGPGFVEAVRQAGDDPDALVALIERRYDELAAGLPEPEKQQLEERKAKLIDRARAPPSANFGEKASLRLIVPWIARLKGMKAGYRRVYIARDAGLFHLMDSVLGKAPDADAGSDVYHMSRARMTHQAYVVMRDIVEDCNEHPPKDVQTFYAQVRERFRDAYEKNALFRHIVDEVRQELEALGYTGGRKIVFADTGYVGTVPFFLKNVVDLGAAKTTDEAGEEIVQVAILLAYDNVAYAKHFFAYDPGSLPDGERQLSRGITTRFGVDNDTAGVYIEAIEAHPVSFNEVSQRIEDTGPADQLELFFEQMLTTRMVIACQEGRSGFEAGPAASRAVAGTTVPEDGPSDLSGNGENEQQDDGQDTRSRSRRLAQVIVAPLIELPSLLRLVCLSFFEGPRYTAAAKRWLDDHDGQTPAQRALRARGTGQIMRAAKLGLIIGAAAGALAARIFMGEGFVPVIAGIALGSIVTAALAAVLSHGVWNAAVPEAPLSLDAAAGPAADEGRKSNAERLIEGTSLSVADLARDEERYAAIGRLSDAEVQGYNTVLRNVTIPMERLTMLDVLLELTLPERTAFLEKYSALSMNSLPGSLAESELNGIERLTEGELSKLMEIQQRFKLNREAREVLLGLFLSMIGNEALQEVREDIARVSIEDLGWWGTMHIEYLLKVKEIYSRFSRFRMKAPAARLLLDILGRRDIEMVHALYNLLLGEGWEAYDAGIPMRSFLESNVSYRKKKELVLIAADWENIQEYSRMKYSRDFDAATRDLQVEKAAGVIRQAKMELLEKMAGQKVPDAVMADETVLNGVLTLLSLSYYSHPEFKGSAQMQKLIQDALKRFLSSGGSSVEVRDWIMAIPENRAEREKLIQEGYDRRLWEEGLTIKGIAGAAVNPGGQKKPRKSEVTVVIAKDCIAEGSAGLDVPGCYNPYAGVQRHMPVVHAFESNAFFARAYNTRGRQIANVVLVLTDKGVIVGAEYNASSLDLNPLWAETWKELSKYAPAVILETKSAGRELIAPLGTESPVKATKRATIWTDPSIEYGNTNMNGDVEFDFKDTSIVTKGSIESRDGFEASNKLQALWQAEREVAAARQARVRAGTVLALDRLGKTFAGDPVLKPYLYVVGKVKTRGLDEVTQEDVQQWYAERNKDGIPDEAVIQKIWGAIESARTSLEESLTLILPDNQAKADALRAKLSGKIGNRFVVELMVGLYVGLIEFHRTLDPFSFYEDHYSGIEKQERRNTVERKIGTGLIWAVMIGTALGMRALGVPVIAGIAAVIAGNIVAHGLWNAVMPKAPLALEGPAAGRDVSDTDAGPERNVDRLIKGTSIAAADLTGNEERLAVVGRLADTEVQEYNKILRRFEIRTDPLMILDVLLHDPESSAFLKEYPGECIKDFPPKSLIASLQLSPRELTVFLEKYLRLSANGLPGPHDGRQLKSIQRLTERDLSFLTGVQRRFANRQEERDALLEIFLSLAGNDELQALRDEAVRIDLEDLWGWEANHAINEVKHLYRRFSQFGMKAPAVQVLIEILRKRDTRTMLALTGLLAGERPVLLEEGTAQRAYLESDVSYRKKKELIMLASDWENIRKDARPEYAREMNDAIRDRQLEQAARVMRKAKRELLEHLTLQLLPDSISSDETVLDGISTCISLYYHHYGGEGSREIASMRQLVAGALQRLLSSRGSAGEVRDWILAMPGNRKEMKKLVRKGYDPRLWSEGITIRGVAGPTTGPEEQTKNREEEITVVISKDFIGDSSAGQDVPGCYNPYTGEDREMPVKHAFEANTFFARAYNARGRQIANVVLALTDRGVVVYDAYNGTSLHLDPLWAEAWKELARYVPAVILQEKSAVTKSAGIELCRSLGVQRNISVTKRATIWGAPYTNLGIPRSSGNIDYDLPKSTILTKASIEANGGFAASREIQGRWQEKREAAAARQARVMAGTVQALDRLGKTFAGDPELKPYLFLVGRIKSKGLAEVTQEDIREWFAEWGNGVVPGEAVLSKIWAAILSVHGSPEEGAAGRETILPGKPGTAAQAVRDAISPFILVRIVQRLWQRYVPPETGVLSRAKGAVYFVTGNVAAARAHAAAVRRRGGRAVIIAPAEGGERPGRATIDGIETIFVDAQTPEALGRKGQETIGAAAGDDRSMAPLAVVMGAGTCGAGAADWNDGAAYIVEGKRAEMTWLAGAHSARVVEDMTGITPEKMAGIVEEAVQVKTGESVVKGRNMTIGMGWRTVSRNIPQVRGLLQAILVSNVRLTGIDDATDAREVENALRELTRDDPNLSVYRDYTVGADRALDGALRETVLSLLAREYGGYSFKGIEIDLGASKATAAEIAAWLAPLMADERSRNKRILVSLSGTLTEAEKETVAAGVKDIIVAGQPGPGAQGENRCVKVTVDNGFDLPRILELARSFSGYCELTFSDDAVVNGGMLGGAANVFKALMRETPGMAYEVGLCLPVPAGTEKETYAGIRRTLAMPGDLFENSKAIAPEGSALGDKMREYAQEPEQLAKLLEGAGSAILCGEFLAGRAGFERADDHLAYARALWSLDGARIAAGSDEDLKRYIDRLAQEDLPNAGTDVIERFVSSNGAQREGVDAALRGFHRQLGTTGDARRITLFVHACDLFGTFTYDETKTMILHARQRLDELQANDRSPAALAREFALLDLLANERVKFERPAQQKPVVDVEGTLAILGAA